MLFALPVSIDEYFKKRLLRFPNFYDKSLSRMYINILANTEETFCNKRPFSHLAYLACMHHFLRKKLIQKMHTSSSRCIFLKCFESNVEGKKVLSITFGVNLRDSKEVLEEKHILKALSCYLSGIRITSRSFFSYLEKANSILFCYLEIEKLRGNPIASREKNMLRDKLPIELKQSIQSLTPSLVVPYNEEETYKNVLQLAQQLKSVDDLPQVMITFEGHFQEMLRFNLIVVRVKKKNSSLLKDLEKIIPSSIRIAIQNSINLESFHKKYVKEALIFVIDIDHLLFLKKNWSIDLRQARNYLVKIMEQTIGAFRDYNGGLFFKQNEQIELVKKILKHKYKDYYSLIDEFFYAFDPPIFQALLSVSVGKQLFRLFLVFLKKKLPSEGILVERKFNKKFAIFMLKTATAKHRDDFIKEIKKLREQNDPCFGFSSLEFEGMHYFCLVDLKGSSSNLNAFKQLSQSLKKKKSSFEKVKLKKILRLNFQEGDPPSLNPHIGVDRRCCSLGKALFEGLTRLNSKGVPELAAAKNVNISASQTVYTFTLREHFWSNGEKVTAYDFEYAWKKALSPYSDCMRADLFYLIKNAKQAKKGLAAVDDVKIKAFNEKTLVVELEYPALYFLHLLAHPIFSPLYMEEEPSCFNGPFIVKDWQRDHLLHLTFNSYYWDRANVKTQDIIISMVKDIRAVLEMFKNKELDWIGDPFSFIPPHENLPTDSQIKIKKVDRLYWIYTNTLSFPLQSAKIRKALAFAINRRKINSELFNGHIPKVKLSEDKKNQGFEFDGNAILAQNLFEKGLKELQLSRKTFPEITFHYSDVPGQERLAEALQIQIESVLRIKIKLIKLEWNNLTNLLDKREHQLAACFRGSPNLYHRSFLELFREHSYPYNSSQWENKKYQTLLMQAHQTTEQKKREEYLKAAEQLLFDEMPVIPIFQQRYKYLLSSKIKKAIITHNGDVDLKSILL